MKCKFFVLLILLCFFCFNKAISQIYKNASVPDSIRIEDLISRMTEKEKFRQLFMVPGEPFSDSLSCIDGLFGFQLNTLTGSTDAASQLMSYEAGNSAAETAIFINRMQQFFIEQSRLGIPIIPFDEALHGLVRKGATAFPQSIGLAATWNTKMMHEVAQAIAIECKTRGIRQILSPVVNVATDVRWGRTEETYGEDPFLVSEMVVAYVSAFEQLGVITTPKHFVANVGDGGRDSYPIHLNERYLREIHFPPFEAAIKRGGARSLMTAYNSYDGSPATANDRLLNQILKNEWGFQGFVISDAGATGGANVLHFTAYDYGDATVRSIQSGLDVIFQTDLAHEKLFAPPFLDRRLDSAAIDAALRRVLKAKFELGLFDQPYVDPMLATQQNENAMHRELARKAALESMVLLKNEDDVLPIGKDVKRIAILGPEISAARLGGYSGPGNNPVSMLKGFEAFIGQKVEWRHAPGCLRYETTFVPVPATQLFHSESDSLKSGLLATYFNNINLQGEPALKRVDQLIDFRWTLFGPDTEKLGYGFYSVEWEGFVRSDVSGIFRIGIDGNDGYQLWLDGKLLIDNSIPRGRSLLTVPFAFEAGQLVPLRIVFSESVGNAWFRLIWDQGAVVTRPEMLEEAVRMADESDLAIVAVGIEEGEFQDRASLALPGKQEELIRSVAATGTPVVVVLVGGSAITMENWLDEVEAVLAVWYPGESGGEAVPEVLFGKYNPAGRLPITFPRFEGQLPLVYNHKPTGRGDDYADMSGQPLFPFGYGLSYTSFSYSGLQLSKSEMHSSDTLQLTFQLKNTGNMDGDEVVQLYLRDELASVARPVMELKGFQRVHLEADEEKEVRFVIDANMLEMLNANLEKVVEPGYFTLMVGASSKDIRLKTRFLIK